MSAVVRISLLLLLSLAVVVGQDQPSPTPTPAAEATPAPSPVAAPSSDAAALASPTPASATDAPPAPVVEPAPSASPAADTIPLEGQPVAPAAPPVSAPLDTQNLNPEGPMPDAAFTDPNAIVPDAPPGPPAMPKAAESTQEKERLLSIRYREVRVEADKDPKVLEMKEQGDKATTMEDERAAMREYYRRLFAKMIAIDPNLKDRCTKMEQAYIRRLAQYRLEPTIPLNPPPTPAPLSN